MGTVIDKRTKEYRDSVNGNGLDIPVKDFSKIENNPGFKLCTKCGAELPPNEDGSEKFRRQGEACHSCVYKHYVAPKKSKVG